MNLKDLKSARGLLILKRPGLPASFRLEAVEMCAGMDGILVPSIRVSWVDVRHNYPRTANFSYDEEGRRWVYLGEAL